LAKKSKQSNEIDYFLEADLYKRFQQWYVAHGKEGTDQRIASFIRAFPGDPLVCENGGDDDSLGILLDHVRLLVEQEEERERVKTDLMYFCQKYLGYADLEEDLHGGGIQELEKAIAAGQRNILILWPRSHLKTSLFSIGRTIQGILRNQNCRKAIISYAYSKAMEILAEIKSHLQNPRLVALFPEILWDNAKKLAPFWREDRITVIRSKVVSGFTLKVNGIGGGYTGEHNDEMVFDDPHDIENTQSIDLILKVIERFKNCKSVLDPDGLRLVVGTIWANEDLYHWCQEHGFYVIRRTATENSQGQECDVDDPDAHAVFPGKFTVDILKQIKAEQGRSFYAKQYNLIPVAEEDIKFPEEMLKNLVYEKDPDYKRIYILIDPALSRTKGSDETAMEFVGEPQDDKLPLHVIKSVGLRKKTQGVINAIFDEYAHYSKECPDVFIGVEQAALQFILIEWLKKEMQERKVFFEPHELKHGSRPKTERISKLEPLFASGGIVLHKSRCEALKQQLINYGATLHDDHVDALAYLPTVLENRAPVQVIDLQARAEKYDPYSLEAVLGQMETTAVNWRDY
jgi:phage terminase large subunit-like protein